MSKRLLQKSDLETEPLYSLIWRKLKTFPKVLAEGSHQPPKFSGPAAAALISAGFGCFLVMVIHHLSETSRTIDKIILEIGSWIPGSKNTSEIWGSLGSYAGKETMLIVGWLLSWSMLHLLWRKKNVKARTIFFWMFVLLVAATAMSWHPLFPYLPLT